MKQTVTHYICSSMWAEAATAPARATLGAATTASGRGAAGGTGKPVRSSSSSRATRTTWASATPSLGAAGHRLDAAAGRIRRRPRPGAPAGGDPAGGDGTRYASSGGDGSSSSSRATRTTWASATPRSSGGDGSSSRGSRARGSRARGSRTRTRKKGGAKRNQTPLYIYICIPSQRRKGGHRNHEHPEDIATARGRARAARTAALRSAARGPGTAVSLGGRVYRV